MYTDLVRLGRSLARSPDKNLVLVLLIWKCMDGKSHPPIYILYFRGIIKKQREHVSGRAFVESTFVFEQMTSISGKCT